MGTTSLAIARVCITFLKLMFYWNVLGKINSKVQFQIHFVVDNPLGEFDKHPSYEYQIRTICHVVTALQHGTVEECVYTQLITRRPVISICSHSRAACCTIRPNCFLGRASSSYVVHISYYSILVLYRSVLK